MNESLTRAERMVLLAYAHGYDAADIAKRYEISTHTVKQHTLNARVKLGAKHATHAVALAIRSGQVVFGASCPTAADYRYRA